MLNEWIMKLNIPDMDASCIPECTPPLKKKDYEAVCQEVDAEDLHASECPCDSGPTGHQFGGERGDQSQVLPHVCSRVRRVSPSELQAHAALWEKQRSCSAGKRCSVLGVADSAAV